MQWKNFKLCVLFFLLVGATSWGTQSSAQSAEDQMRACHPTDAVCVGLVLLRAIRSPVSAANVRQTTGFLEVFHEGEWRGVCDDNFDQAEGEVVCRELGQVYSSFNSVSGSGSFWLDDLSCSGSESSLISCSSAGWGNHNCGASEHVLVTCN
jgi:hypothetical protein